MTGNSACLGLEFLGSCSYDPADPGQSYFTIGQLVSVIALLLAFSQLTKPIIKFRIRANKTSYKTAIVICLLATACIFVAAILPFIPGRAWPLLGYPVFWEILAGFLLVGIAAVSLTVISRRPRFKSRNAAAYLNACAAVISKGNDDDLRELADEIIPVIKPIFAECKSHDSYEARIAK